MVQLSLRINLWIKALIMLEDENPDYIRALVLIYIAQRNYNGYYWGDARNIANDLCTTLGNIQRIISDFVDIGAIVFIKGKDLSYMQLPDDLDVIRLTGVFEVNGVEYIYDMQTEYDNEPNRLHFTPPPVLKQKPQSMQMGYVYFATNDKLIKIGHTIRLDKRMDVLGIEPIHHLQIVDYRKLERWFHDHFAYCRVKGEWFDLGETAIAWIKNLQSDGKSISHEGIAIWSANDVR